MTPPSHKTCTKCREKKPYEDFTPKKTASDGRHSWCKRCTTDKQISDYHSSPKRQYRVARNTASKRGLAFTLSYDEWSSLRFSPCSYCGMEIKTSGIGLDRLDNCRGYVHGNVAPACVLCNAMRGDVWTPSEMKILGTVVSCLIKLRRNPAPDIIPARWRNKAKESA